MSHFLSPDFKVSCLLRHRVDGAFNLPAQLRLVLLSTLPQRYVQKLIDRRRGNISGDIGLIHLTQRDCETIKIRLDSL